MSKDVYTEVAEYIANLVVLCDYSAWLVKLSLDGRKTTEMLSYDREDGFTWDNDWYEGESDVQVIDFVCVNNVDPAMRWHSVAKDGLPPDEEMVLVTIQYKGGFEVYDGFKHCSDLTKYVDMRYKNGKDFVMKHQDGAWYSYHSDGFWEYWSDGVGYEIVAWMPYPEPYGVE